MKWAKFILRWLILGWWFMPMLLVLTGIVWLLDNDAGCQLILKEWFFTLPAKAGGGK